ncbi:MAG: hypothetical protein JWQ44_2170 [Chthoniobacter sp.]|nr:hypothetical protein [Chthoniobacter sp.]
MLSTKPRTLLLALLFGCVVALPVSGLAITFNLRDVGAELEIESGTITRGGVTATLLPSVVGSSGVLNQTAGGFGINGAGADVTNLLDGTAGAESISLSFNTNVLFSGLTLSSFSAGESALLKIGAFPTLTLTDTGNTPDTFVFNTNNSVIAGQTVVLTFGSGNGFSFDSFTIEPVASAAVPETSPGIIGMACLLGVIGFAHRRRSLGEATSR